MLVTSTFYSTIQSFNFHSIKNSFYSLSTIVDSNIEFCSKVIHVFNEQLFKFYPHKKSLPTFSSRSAAIVDTCLAQFVSSKNRFRLSGRGFSFIYDSEFKTLKVDAGASKPFLLNLPAFLNNVILGRKKKKIMLIGIFDFNLNHYRKLVCSLRKCDPYKHKGLRLYREKLRYKKSKKKTRR
jgi:hypothetical protein